jgi:hypothetical protein
VVVLKSVGSITDQTSKFQYFLFVHCLCSAGLHTWASSVDEVVKCWTDQTTIDQLTSLDCRLFDDSAGRLGNLVEN